MKAFSLLVLLCISVAVCYRNGLKKEKLKAAALYLFCSYPVEQVGDKQTAVVLVSRAQKALFV